MALQHFVTNKCDYIVVETGLGGRLDATNSIVPLLSVITNIGLDHQQILGETKVEIAGEKAGIIKANIPVLIGEKDPELVLIFRQKAKECNADFFELKEQTNTFIQQNQSLAKTAIHLLSKLGEFNYSEDQVKKGLLNVSKNTGFLGRFQKIGTAPDIIVDAAHNEDGVEALFNELERFAINNFHIIYGASSDKKVREIVRLFPENPRCYFTSFSHERAMSLEQLKISTSDFPQDKIYFENEQEALNRAKESANQKDTILIFGSFFLIEKFL
jgi:dihydrofolate synthase/folylpolyglutamate synthase